MIPTRKSLIVAPAIVLLLAAGALAGGAAAAEPAVPAPPGAERLSEAELAGLRGTGLLDFLTALGPTNRVFANVGDSTTEQTGPGDLSLADTVGGTSYSLSVSNTPSETSARVYTSQHLSTRSRTRSFSWSR